MANIIEGNRPTAGEDGAQGPVGEPARRYPVHLVFVGIFAFIWSALNAFDFVMILIRSDWYLRDFYGLSEPQIRFYRSYPLWAIIVWGLAVWPSLAGAIALLVRSRLAFTLLGTAAAATLLAMLYNFVLADVTLSTVLGSGALYFSLLILLIAGLLALYAFRGIRSGWLR